jgi:hypothetical protein
MAKIKNRSPNSIPSVSQLFQHLGYEVLHILIVTGERWWARQVLRARRAVGGGVRARLGSYWTEETKALRLAAAMAAG